MFKTMEKMAFVANPSDPSPFSNAGFKFRILGVGSDKPSGLHSLKQVHGTDLVKAQAGITDIVDSALDGDGIYSASEGQVVGVKTADCLPVIVGSRSQTFISVVHAGWRGLNAGILKRVVNLAKDYSKEDDLYAFFGPCIGLGAFEVGPEVFEAFASKDFGLTSEQLAWASHRGKSDRWHLDLALIGAWELVNSGCRAENITILRSCTYSLPELWYSYRRTGSATPSNWTMAWV